MKLEADDLLEDVDVDFDKSDKTINGVSDADGRFSKVYV